MKIAYLDQNQWIQLARIHHGRLTDPALVAALTAVNTAVSEGRLGLPLSAIHYMETARVTQPGRRARLGTVMWELSRDLTIASYRSILTFELETALRKRFPHIKVRPFQLISQGVAHAFGMEVAPFRLAPAFRSVLSEAVAADLEARINAIAERALVTGEGPPGVPMLTFGLTEHNRRFQEHLSTLHPRLTQLPPDQWDDLLYAISVVDILEPLNEVAGYHKLDKDAIATSKEHMQALVDDLPSRRIDLQLHRQLSRNPALKPKANDLEDWAALAPAAAHCDFLVCEKHFADLVQRDGFQTKATVLTSVRDLATALVKQGPA